MSTCPRSTPSSNREEDKRKLKEKLKRDRKALEERIAKQTKEFEADRCLTQKRLKMWMDPKNSGAFERTLSRHTKREAKALKRRVSHKLKSIKKERRDLQSRLVWFRPQNYSDPGRQSDENYLRGLLKRLRCARDSSNSKKKRRIVEPCGNG